MPRRIKDLLFTVITLLVLAGMLVSINPNLRERLQLFVADPQWDTLADTAVHTILSAAFLAQGYADHHLYLFTFLVAACVFFVLMLKVIS